MESVTASGRHGEGIGVVQEGRCVTCGVICDLSFDQVCGDEVAYSRHKRSDKRKLESEVKEHIYPPAIPFVVQYDSPPDCSSGAKTEKFTIKGTNKGQIAFPFEVYQVKNSMLVSSAALQHSDESNCH